ncbi:hypothetical protein [Delftia tsuruhatensis]|uniref:rolling circle replication-associated protein n=1 Tax=Delftia tsuruhatensis TaxID=180282 RepID=UPI0006191D25|nr:hypothetical protein [Delftia tsuruhatensis]
MQRIISVAGQRVLLDGHTLPDAWDVSIKTVNGHRETSFRNAVVWTESALRPPPEMSREDYLAQFEGEELAVRLRELEKEDLERKQKQQEKNAGRAKSACRWFIKANGLNELLTITYRENQEDRALCKLHFKEWVRRMKRALGGQFVYCAAFERQERGAMHVHVACHKLPKHVMHKGVKIEAWRLGTEVWRAIVGADNGLCFVGGRNKSGNRYTRTRSIAKIAAYVSKYIMKDYLGAPGESNRYSRSDKRDGVADMPKAERIRIWGRTFEEMVELAFDCRDGEVIVSHRITRDDFRGDRYWLVTEPDSGSEVLPYVQ